MPTAVIVTTYIFVFLFGLCIFSFGNVLVYRIPNKMDFVRGRSLCPSCGHALAARDLVPVLSYLALRGRCRYCKARISPRYPLVELWGGALACLTLWRFGLTLQAAAVFFAALLLTVIALIDCDTMEIPDGLVLALALLAAAQAVLDPSVPLMSRIIGMFAASVPMLLINLLIPTSFGGGDVKLVAAAGFFLGWRALVVGVFIALLLGGGYGVYLLRTKKAGRKDHFAFGPFLNLGLITALYFGEQILQAYLSLF